MLLPCVTWIARYGNGRKTAEFVTAKLTAVRARIDVYHHVRYPEANVLNEAREITRRWIIAFAQFA